MVWEVRAHNPEVGVQIPSLQLQRPSSQGLCCPASLAEENIELRDSLTASHRPSTPHSLKVQKGAYVRWEVAVGEVVLAPFALREKGLDETTLVDVGGVDGVEFQELMVVEDIAEAHALLARHP